MLFDLPVEAIVPELVSVARDDVLAELAANLVSRSPELSTDEVVRILVERELLGSTGIGDGVAIPHGKLQNVAGKPLLVFGRSSDGVEFNSLDGRRTHLFFLILASAADVGAHLRILAKISRVMKDPVVRKELIAAGSAGEIHAVIHRHGGDET
jgi:PTS system nitrogen regulatory IIA component